MIKYFNGFEVKEAVVYILNSFGNRMPFKVIRGRLTLVKMKYTIVGRFSNTTTFLIYVS